MSFGISIIPIPSSPHIIFILNVSISISSMFYLFHFSPHLNPPSNSSLISFPTHISSLHPDSITIIMAGLVSMTNTIFVPPLFYFMFLWSTCSPYFHHHHFPIPFCHRHHHRHHHLICLIALLRSLLQSCFPPTLQTAPPVLLGASFYLHPLNMGTPHRGTRAHLS